MPSNLLCTQRPSTLPTWFLVWGGGLLLATNMASAQVVLSKTPTGSPGRRDWAPGSLGTYLGTGHRASL